MRRRGDGLALLLFCGRNDLRVRLLLFFGQPLKPRFDQLPVPVFGGLVENIEQLFRPRTVIFGVSHSRRADDDFQMGVLFSRRGLFSGIELGEFRGKLFLFFPLRGNQRLTLIDQFGFAFSDSFEGARFCHNRTLS